MEEMSAFERQVAVALQEMAGPGRRIDSLAVAHAAASRSPGWGLPLPSMIGAARLVAAAAVVALFAGVLAAGLLPASPQRGTLPGAATTALPSAMSSPTASVTPSGAVDTSPTARAGGQSRYQATARLRVDPGPSPSLSDLASAAAALVRYAGMAERVDVAEAVTVQLGLDESPGSLLARITTHVSPETLELSLLVADDDPEAARAIAQALGNEMRVRILDMLITDDVRAADVAVASTRRSLKTLTSRLDQLRRKASKSARDRSEMIALAGTISSLQQNVLGLLPSTRAFVRNRLEWLDEPTVGERSDAIGWRGEAMPTRGIALASEAIERGTIIGAGHLTPLIVPADWAEGMAFIDATSALGWTAAIDIPAGQLITASMLLDE
jgi:hypothetical protein